jgi:collagenase-like PrtC family protease
MATQKAKMRFSVPTNWDDSLLERLPYNSVCEVYGALQSDIVGGGRASVIIPSVSKKKAAAYIKRVRTHGTSFNYVLNSVCLNNVELSKHWQLNVRRFIAWLADSGVDCVTVSLPFMAKMIKREFPGMRVSVSVQANINSVREAQLWEDLGVAKLNLSVLDSGRNFELLRAIRAAVSCDLQLIANLKCLAGCPFYKHHATLNAHASRRGDTSDGFVVDYCYLQCHLQRVLHPVEFIKSHWIRPEDVHHYAAIGINSLKLVERQMPTDNIIKIIQAYVLGAYNGNLFDLLPSQSKSLLNTERSFSAVWRRVRFLFRPWHINPMNLLKLRALVNEEKVMIDNCALDGFIDYFISGKCTGLCATCDYCTKWAERVVSIDQEYQNACRCAAKDLFDELHSGKFFC